MNQEMQPQDENILYAKHRKELNFAQSGNLWRKVSCAVNAATSTPSFIGNFITDKIPDAEVSRSDTTSDSPVFYKSSSSNAKSAVYQKSESVRVPLTPNSLFESMKIDQNYSSTTNTSEYLFSTKSTLKNNYRLSNSTSNDTFGFLFPFNKNQRRIETNRELDVSEVIPMEVLCESSPRYYSNILLSAKRKPTRKVNFNFPQSLANETSPKEREVTNKISENRKMSSFTFSTKGLGPDNCHDNFPKSNFTKLISIKSKKPLIDLLEPRNRSYLPSNPGGDTCDNQYDQIIIYPYQDSSGTVKPQQQLASSLRKEVTTQTVGPSETSKVRFSSSIDLNKPQKIFSQLHTCPKSTNEMTTANFFSYKEIKNHSIEMIKFFHKSLMLEDY